MVTAPNLRGKCTSTHGKYTKSGELKRSGNFSLDTFRQQSLQSKDYFVSVHKYEDTGIEVLIVGDHTPLASIMGEYVEMIALHDERFDTYTQKGVKTIGGQECDVRVTLKRDWLGERWFIMEKHRFVLRAEVYTNGQPFEFPEY